MDADSTCIASSSRIECRAAAICDVELARLLTALSAPVDIIGSIIVQFRVVDATAAIHDVDSYEERLYSDVQLAAP